MGIDPLRATEAFEQDKQMNTKGCVVSGKAVKFAQRGKLSLRVIIY